MNIIIRSFVIVFFAGFTWLLLGWQSNTVHSKTYSVSYTQDQWINKLKLLSDAKEVMRKSSYPGTVISSVTDSLEVLIKEINEQVGGEVQREAAKAKTDTSHKAINHK